MPYKFHSRYRERRSDETPLPPTNGTGARWHERKQPMKYNIGDSVWFGTYDTHGHRVTCPDCAGSGKLKVTFADGVECLFECGCCSRGYEGSVGWVTQYEKSPKIEGLTITGVEIRTECIVYHCGSWVIEESKLHHDADSALAYATGLKEEEERVANEPRFSKHQDRKSYGWNAHYHRKCIKQKEQELEYHRNALSVCATQAKIEKQVK